ncbi:MAG TPA: MFS transporter [Mycobacteriales bacterium]|nr:MFS transporter [Mycobacteriales bacterium]
MRGDDEAVAVDREDAIPRVLSPSPPPPVPGPRRAAPPTGPARSGAPGGPPEPEVRDGPAEPDGTAEREARRLAVVLGVLFGLVATGSSAVAVVLPAIQDDLGLSHPAVAWVLSIYVLSLAVTTAVYGRVADVVGIRRPLVVGMLVMAAGAGLAAAAPALPVLLVGRVLQGAGAGAVPVLATALVTARFTGTTRSAALGRVAGASATVSALGPLLGGVIAEVGGWHAVVALPLAGLLLLPLVAPAAPSRGTGGRVDLPGAGLVAVTAIGLVLLLQSVSAGLVAAGVGAALVLAGLPLTVRHVRRRPEGFLPRAVVTRGAVLRAALAGASIPAAWFAVLLAIPIALDDRGWSTLQIGLALVPSAVVGLLGGRVSGPVLDRLGPRRTLAGAALLAAASLAGGAAAVGAGWPVVMAAVVVTLTISFAVGQPAMVSAVGTAVPAPVRGIALGIASLVFLVGGSLGSATVGGLADGIGAPAALLAVAVLPVAGALVVALGGRRAART